MSPMFLSENADAKLIIQRINSLVDAYLSLDERIARFETGAAYEREALDADAKRDITHAMSKFVDNGDGTLSWPKVGGSELREEWQSMKKSRQISDLIFELSKVRSELEYTIGTIKAAKDQSNYLIGILNDNDYQFSSIDELRVFMRDGIEHTIISLSYGED